MKTSMTADVADRLRAHGHKVTPQRLSVWESLARGGHMTADQVTVALRDDTDFADASTVYRTLDLFCAIGLARMVRLVRPESFYEPACLGFPESPHSHFVCTRCGVITDLVIDECTEPAECSCSAATSARAHGRVGLVQSVVTGICKSCDSTAHR